MLTSYHIREYPCFWIRRHLGGKAEAFFNTDCRRKFLKHIQLLWWKHTCNEFRDRTGHFLKQILILCLQICLRTISKYMFLRYVKSPLCLCTVTNYSHVQIQWERRDNGDQFYEFWHRSKGLWCRREFLLCSACMVLKTVEACYKNNSFVNNKCKMFVINRYVN